MNSGDTVFVIMSAALVMIMTPGLALFYGGLARGKNVLGTIMQSFVILALISLEWVLWGYSMAFGPDHSGIIGGLDWFGLSGVGMEPSDSYATTVPHLAFMIFQGMFAVITPALITGAFAERMKFSAFLLFALLWATFVYNPLAHWVWGAGGWMGKMGALDFAGGGGSPYKLRRIRAGRSPYNREKAWIWNYRFYTPQYSNDGYRSRSSMVRLVRLQRRKRTCL